MSSIHDPRPGTLRELKRQASFLETIMKRADDNHEFVQSKRRDKLAKLAEQIASSEELQNMEAAL